MGKALLAVLASGEGTTAEALILACLEGEIDCEVGLVISSSESAGYSGVSTESIRSAAPGSPRPAWDARPIRQARERGCALVIKLLPRSLLFTNC